MAKKKLVPFRETMENLTRMAESGRPISAEVLYNLLEIVIDDVYQLNQDLGQKTMEPGDPRTLVSAVCNVLEESVQTLEDNKEGLQQLASRTQEECQELLNQAQAQKEQLGKIRETLAAKDKARAEWDERCKALEAEQARLYEVEQECEKLQARATQLNDGALAEQEALLDALRADLGVREKRNASLQADIDASEKALAAAKQEEAQKLEQKEKMQAEVDALSQRIMELDEKATFFRSEQERLSKDVQEAEQNNNCVLEQGAKYTAIYTALNAALHDPALRENLFTLAGTGEALSVESIPDLGETGVKIESIEDLDLWATSIQTRIEGLIGIYQAQLGKIVELGARITLTGEDEVG